MKGMPAREENDLASVRDALTHMSRGYARCFMRACVYVLYIPYILRDTNGRTRDTRPCNHLGEACA